METSLERIVRLAREVDAAEAELLAEVEDFEADQRRKSFEVLEIRSLRDHGKAHGPRDRGAAGGACASSRIGIQRRSLRAAPSRRVNNRTALNAAGRYEFRRCVLPEPNDPHVVGVPVHR
jgi:hypothetical protein